MLPTLPIPIKTLKFKTGGAPELFPTDSQQPKPRYQDLFWFGQKLKKLTNFKHFICYDGPPQEPLTTLALTALPRADQEGTVLDRFSSTCGAHERHRCPTSSVATRGGPKWVRSIGEHGRWKNDEGDLQNSDGIWVSLGEGEFSRLLQNSTRCTRERRMAGHSRRHSTRCGHQNHSTPWCSTQQAFLGFLTLGTS